MNKAIFLDRDGVINHITEDVKTIRREEQFHIIDGVVEAVNKFKEAGYLIIVATNQPEVSRGTLSIEALNNIHDFMKMQLDVDDIYVCTHTDEDNCECRKPKPGMLVEAAKKWDIDLSKSYMVGDREKDIIAGQKAGCTSAYVDNSYRLIELSEDILSYTRRYFGKLLSIIRSTDLYDIDNLVDGLSKLKARQGRLFFVGVGGGAGNASHAVNDFRKIANIESYAVTDNVSELTARVNDDGWDSCYVEYLRGSRLNANDAVFVLSVGGGDIYRNISMNIVKALSFANDVGAEIFGIVGRDGGYTKEMSDMYTNKNVCVIIPSTGSDVTPFVESMQSVILHLLVSHPKLKSNEMKWESV